MPKCRLLVMRISTKSGLRAFVSSDLVFSSLMERETSHSFDLWVTAIVSLSGSTQFSRGKEVHDHQGGFKQSATVNRLNVRDDASRCKTSPAALAPQVLRREGIDFPCERETCTRVSTLAD